MDKTVFLLFLSWRLGLFFAAFLATFFLPFNFSFPYVKSELLTTGLPEWIWGFGNFDGVHYLKIAKEGYIAEYVQAFFPVYPLLINFLSLPNWEFIVALLISNIAFLIALLFVYKLFLLDFDKHISLKSIVLVLCFPTAFYFGAIYTEGIFFLFTVLSFYFLRKENFLLSGIFAALASGTRIIGVFLLPVILYKFIVDKRWKDLKAILGVLIAPLGLISYMLYLGLNHGDALYFLNVQSEFGGYRTDDSLILLPQVIFRYLKILFSVDITTLAFFNAFLEFTLTFLFIGAVIFLFKKIKKEYLIFIIPAFILPTLTGTLTSMPRYLLVSIFILPLIVKLKEKYFWIIALSMGILEVVLVAMFVRGYWVA